MEHKFNSNFTDQSTPINIVGPCSLESQVQIDKIASMASELGLTYIRTPLYKPRTHAHSFQGLGLSGHEILVNLKLNFPKLKSISEVCSIKQYEQSAHLLDAIQIGSRNMQNFELLKELGKVGNAHDFIMLKRGLSATLEEWLASADYLISHGLDAKKLVLCERGIRDHAGVNGVILDFASAVMAKMKGFKVIMDPSHGTKEAKLVLPLLKIIMGMNLDGYMVEVHPTPEKSVSDAKQAISIEDFKNFYATLTTEKREQNVLLSPVLNHNSDQSEQYKN